MSIKAAVVGVWLCALSLVVVAALVAWAVLASPRGGLPASEVARLEAKEHTGQALLLGSAAGLAGVRAYVAKKREQRLREAEAKAQ